MAVGTLQIRRTEANPFTDKQIALLGTFAARAVIAIENARLLNELRQRTSDLSESLEQQTATSEVLKVISSSPGELKPVFDTILENATRICEAEFGVLCSYDGNLFKYAAVWNAPPVFLEFNYFATVDARSNTPQFGTRRQSFSSSTTSLPSTLRVPTPRATADKPYVIEAQMSGNRVSSAVIV